MVLRRWAVRLNAMDPHTFMRNGGVPNPYMMTETPLSRAGFAVELCAVSQCSGLHDWDANLFI